MKSFGIFFIAYQERFHASSSEVSLILTISNLTTSFTGKRPITIRAASRENLSSGFPTKQVTKQSPQRLRLARSLKFLWSKV